eukprot:GHVU01086834.1.p1 GENE.GHVU01086834.1~~GHVU01086834.1.p1  ORF type:complete len:458 (-),score=125.44 GHVU01086834.1:109-1482(-)
MRYAAIYTLGQIAPRITSKKRGEHLNIDSLVASSILREMQGPDSHPFLRLRCCWFVGEIAGGIAAAKRDINKVPSMMTAAAQLLRCAQEPLLPVKVQAAISFVGFLEATKTSPALDAFVRENVAGIVQALAECLRSFPHEGIAASIAGLVENYPAESAPFVVLVTNLFADVLLSSFNNQDTDFADELVQSTLMSTIRSLLSCLDDHPQKSAAYREAAPRLLQLVAVMLRPQWSDFFEDSLPILRAIVWNLSPAPDAVWELCVLMHRSIVAPETAAAVAPPPPLGDEPEDLGWAPDMLPYQIPVWTALMIREPDRFLRQTDPQGTRFVDLLLQIARQVIVEKSYDISGGMLLLSVLFECLGPRLEADAHAKAWHLYVAAGHILAKNDPRPEGKWGLHDPAINAIVSTGHRAMAVRGWSAMVLANVDCFLAAVAQGSGADKTHEVALAIASSATATDSK